MNRRDHWEAVYRTREDGDLSWLQTRPAVSLRIIDSIEPTPRRAIDVGGGQSCLAGELLDRGVESMTVLDISEAALERARKRLGERAVRVRWVAADVLQGSEPGPFDLWHDRAVFHFLTAPEDRRSYADAAARAVSPGGRLLVATFAPTGPERCSGLDVRRYDARGLATEFAPAFEFEREETETHTTPWGKPQDFVYALLRRLPR